MLPANPHELLEQAILPTITEAADLVALLAEAPRRRAVAYEPLADAAARPRVYEYPGERIEEQGRALALIGAGSAYGLLHAAVDADIRYDLDAWAACPIRYRSGQADATWLHADHPAAPAAPCINDPPRLAR